MSLKVTTDEKNPQLWKVLIAAKLGKVDVTADVVQNAHSTEVLAKSPLGKVPVLETSEGNIFEANAITRYIARLAKGGNLYGKTDFEAGLIEQYLDFANNDIELPGAVWIYPILGFIANNQVATTKAQADIKKALNYLNDQLATRTFLVGERVTIADIVVAMSLYYLFQKVLDANFRRPFQNVVRWYTTFVNQPEVKAVVGDSKLAEKTEVAPATFTPKEQPKDTKKEEKKPAKKEEKKEEKKPAKKDDDEEEEESFEDETPKNPNPLDLLPKSTMILDEWKRVYSNAKDTKGQAMPWFWEHLDKEGYSLWFCDYKYNHECEKVFMTCNLLGGWIQRLDKLRKYAFGSLAIFGEEPKLEVSGAWLFRGQDVPQEMKDCDDSEHYTWRKVDPNDAATRELVGDYFAWDGNFGNGKHFNQGKIFK